MERDENEDGSPTKDPDDENDGEKPEDGEDGEDTRLQVEVSILDLDGQGSVNLDKGSEDDGRASKLLPDGADNSGDLADIVASETNFFKTIPDSVGILGAATEELAE